MLRDGFAEAKARSVGLLTIAVVVPIALAPVPSQGAPQYTHKTLHNFCAYTNCADGAGPNGLLRDRTGNLYGTTNGGGKYGCGTIYKLVRNPDTGQWKEYVLHAFQDDPGCYPSGNLIMDVDGNLYGTTFESDGCDAFSYGCGTIFKLTHGSRALKLRVLHTFCSPYQKPCPDGSNPEVGLSYAGQASGAPWDEVSPLFGTTNQGGTHDVGAVYELTVNGSLWSFTVIHSFDSAFYPNALAVNSTGDIFGTTQQGGKYNSGLIYKIEDGTWKTTVLHNFCNTANCADGAFPSSGLLIDDAGNLFGTTLEGGVTSNCGSPGCGVVFERAVGGTYNVLYKFCSLSACADGSKPKAGLLMDSSGDLFGTTSQGGTAKSWGTVFELTSGSWTESVLYNFCKKANCTDGRTPSFDPLIMDGSGDIFGSTFYGGTHGDYGTVFELVPG